MKGNVIKQNAEGLQARVVQHEYDHLMGIVYTQRLVDNKSYGFADEIEEYWKNNHEKN
jgi:peptide deformylase